MEASERSSDFDAECKETGEHPRREAVAKDVRRMVDDQFAVAYERDDVPIDESVRSDDGYLPPDDLAGRSPEVPKYLS